MRSVLPGLAGSACGSALRAASNAAALSPVEPRTGIFSVKSPSCGTHSLRHTSQAACSRTSRSLPSADGWNAGEIVSGTGSSTVSA